MDGVAPLPESTKAGSRSNVPCAPPEGPRVRGLGSVVRWLLNHLPSPVLAGLIVAAAVGVGALAELWHWRSHQRRPQPVRSNEMLTVAVEFVGVAYAILIGFVIVNLWQD